MTKSTTTAGRHAGNPSNFPAIETGQRVESEVNFLRAARVVSEDDEALTVEVRKADALPADVDSGDSWAMVVFVRQDDSRTPEPWLPWLPRDR